MVLCLNQIILFSLVSKLNSCIYTLLYIYNIQPTNEYDKHQLQQEMKHIITRKLDCRLKKLSTENTRIHTPGHCF